MSAKAEIVPAPAPWVDKMTIANKMLAEVADDPFRASRVWDFAEAARVYAIQVGLGVDAVNHAVAVKLKAQRLLAEAVDHGQENGEIATRQTANLGGVAKGTQVRASDLGPKTFADIGIEKQRVSEARKIRDAFTDADIDTAAHDASLAGEELTSAQMLARARDLARERERVEPGPARFGTSDERPDSFPTIVIDPPWRYGNSATRGAAEDHYPTMSYDELKALVIPATEDAHLYLWVTNNFLREGLDLCEAWGFIHKTMLTWVKPQMGMGNYFRSVTEHVLFGVRGTLPTARRDRTNVVNADRTRHSAKPDAFYDLVEEMSPGPYLDMFSRSRRMGWHTWGNEA